MAAGSMDEMPGKRSTGRVCLAAAVSVALTVFVWCRTGIHFETNDDVYITAILSGVITGQPDAHVIHVNYLLALPLALLYRITVNVPWYGGMLVFFMTLCWGAMLDSAYTRCSRKLYYAPVTAALAGLFAAFYYCMGLVEFTSTAAFLAVGGYVCLLLRRNVRTGLIWFFVLELLAFLLRWEAMLMVQPLGLAAAAAAMPERLRQKEGWRELLKTAALLVLILCIGGTGNLAGYHGKAWDRYRQFNDTRVLLFDYYGTPDYEEVRPILEEYGVSREKYEAYRSYMILDWKMDGSLDERMMDYMEEHQERPSGKEHLLRDIYRVSVKDAPWRIQYVTGAAWGIFVLWMLLNRQWVRCLGGVLILGARTAVWAYLVWRGRLPLRVTLPLSACEIIFLITLVWRNFGEVEAEGYKKALLLSVCGVSALLCVRAGSGQIRHVEKTVASQQILMKGLGEIREYCDSRPGNRYLLDAHSMTYYTGSVFETDVYQPTNAVYGGGWFSNTPGTQKRLEEYLGKAPGFYFLVIAEGGQANSGGMAYLVQEMGQEPRLADQWTASHGGTYDVYYFEGAFPFS